MPATNAARTQPDQKVVDRLGIAQRACLALTALIATIIISGWLVPTIGAALPDGWTLMKTNTALSMLLCAVALFLAGLMRSDRYVLGRWACGSVVLLLSGGALLEHWRGHELGLDNLLAQDHMVSMPGRMSIQTATFLILLGLLLIFERSYKRSYKGVANFLDVLTSLLILGTLTLLAGYVFAAPLLVGQSKVTRTSPQTLACMVLLTLAAVVFRTQNGIFSIFVDDGRGSQIFRRLFLVIFFAPFLLITGGYYAMAGGWLSAPYAAALTAALSSFMFVSLSVVGARMSNDYESARLHEERNRLMAELSAERENARIAAEANRTKSIFLANMSHELRTPLNAVLGYAQLLAGAPNLTTSQIGACNTIQQSGEHLLMLIVDILDLAKIETGKLELQLDAVELRVFLQGIVDIIRIRAENKELSFACTLASDLPVFVQVDQKRLRQVLLNLLWNAVKFTDEGGVEFQVKGLSLSPEETQLSFEVRDTGIGIAPDQLENIFRSFDQVGDAQHRAGGTGLGLSISLQLVRLMGSDLHVESALGRGSCFSFDMRAVTTSSGHPPSQMNTHIVGYEGSRKRVLVVDDIEANRSMMSDTLTTLGFDVTEATNGLEALASAQNMVPDLILTDIRMPVMGGLELMLQMQALPNLCQVPVIAISAVVTNEKQRDCMAAGAKAFLTKPIYLPTLFHETGRLLNLTWIREVADQEATPGNDVIEQFGIPEPEQMEALRALAKEGNMRAIREKAEELSALNECYRPFADRIIQLAIGYQSKALLRLVEKYAAQPMEPIEQM